ncbi:MAG: oligosaccharide flippase family protein [Candidatus ainarchaeum sp.]|nr:oligosaccharide flippase family protein [Candidatus ainarchaeum sp.]
MPEKRAQPHAEKWYDYILKENAYGVAAQVVVFLAGLLVTITFPRILGTEGFGYFSLALVTANAAMFFADFGIFNVLLRMMPVGMREGNAQRYYAMFRAWKLALAFLSSSALFLASDFLAGAVFKAAPLAPALKLAAGYLFLYALYTFYDYYFISLKKNKFSLAISIAYNLLRFLLPLAVFLLISPDFYGFLAGTIAALALSVLASSFLARGIRLPSKPHELNMEEVKRLLFYGSLSYLAGNLLIYSDTLAVGILLPASDVGIYRVAWLWATASAFLLPFSLRTFSSIHAYESMEKSAKIISATFKYTVMLVFLMLLGILAVSDKFLVLFYGPEFAVAYPILGVLSLMLFDMALSPIFSSLFIGKGYLGKPTTVGLASGAILIALLATLTPAYGLMGAAASIVAARTLNLFGTAWLAMRLAKFRLSPSLVLKPALAALASFLILKSFLPLTGLLNALILGFASVALYGIALILLRGIELNEIESMLRGALGRRVRKPAS